MKKYQIIYADLNSFTVREIPSSQTYDWLLYKHYAHRRPSISWAFGLYDGSSILQGVCTFGVPASHSLCIGICGEDYKQLVLELNRLCLNDELPKNSASFLIARSIKLLPIERILVSYSDTGMGHTGYIYQATNWLYTGITKERTDIATGVGKHSRHYEKGGDYSNRQLRTAKHRYILFHKCPQGIREALKYPILPYPKGDNERYDTSYQPPVQRLLG